MVSRRLRRQKQGTRFLQQEKKVDRMLFLDLNIETVTLGYGVREHGGF